MNKTLLMVAMLTVAASAHAGNTYNKQAITSPVGNCHEAKVADTRLLWGKLNIVNVGTTAATVRCSPSISYTNSGTVGIGTFLGNTTASNVVATCVGSLSTGGKGPIDVTRSVILPAKVNGVVAWQEMAWSATDVGGKSLMGQSAFSCALPPGAALAWNWVYDTSN